MNNRRLTTGRLVLAVTSSAAEEFVIYAIWRWLLPQWDIVLPVAALVGAMVAWGIFSIWLFIFTTRTLKKQVPVGLPSMVGTVGRAASQLAPEGLVRIRSELWVATTASGEIQKGENIKVTGEDGLRLVVRKNDVTPPIH
jgi:membrane-bound ClpP family serine protease